MIYGPLLAWLFAWGGEEGEEVEMSVVVEEADEILSYTVTLDEILADQAEEMDMYDGDSE